MPLCVCVSISCYGSVIPLQTTSNEPTWTDCSCMNTSNGNVCLVHDSCHGTAIPLQTKCNEPTQVVCLHDNQHALLIWECGLLYPLVAMVQCSLLNQIKWANIKWPTLHLHHIQHAHLIWQYALIAHYVQMFWFT